MKENQYSANDVNALHQLNATTFGIVESALKVVRNLKGNSAIIPRGKFKGRWGKIDGCIYCNSNGLSATIVPYDVKKKDGSVVNHNTDTHNYWPISEVKTIVKGVCYE